MTKETLVKQREHVAVCLADATRLVKQLRRVSRSLGLSQRPSTRTDEALRGHIVQALSGCASFTIAEALATLAPHWPPDARAKNRKRRLQRLLPQLSFVSTGSGRGAVWRPVRSGVAS